MNAFYLIDKPLHISSFDIIRQLRKKLNIKKIGHTGTLDPLASGLVLVAVGKYTKLIPFLEKDQKTYDFTIGLDGTTETYDLEKNPDFISSEEQEKFRKLLTKKEIQKLLDQHFSGTISQIPPKYSALKINGQKAVNVMRKGGDIELKSRNVQIHHIKINHYQYPDISLCATVSAGTYIRSIASDLGKLIGSGGYIKFLRRTYISNLKESESIQLENFDEHKKLNTKSLFPKHTFIQLTEKQIEEIKMGKFIKIDHFSESNYLFVEKNEEIISILEKRGDLWKAKVNI